MVETSCAKKNIIDIDIEKEVFGCLKKIWLGKRNTKQ